MKIVLLIVSLSIFISPSIGIGGIPLRLEDPLFLLIIFFITLKRGGLPSLTKDFGAVMICFLFFIGSNFLSLFFSSFRGYDVASQDINTILMYLKAVIVLLVGYYIGLEIKNVKYNFIIYSLLSGIIISCLLTVVQYFDLMGLGVKTYLIYGNEDRIEYGISRAIGTLGNPNYASYFHIIGFILALNIHIKSGSDKILKIIFLVITFLGVILTFSRTGFLSLFLVWSMVLLFKNKIRQLFITFCLLCLSFILFADKIIGGTRFEQTQSGSSGGSLTDFGNRSDLIWDIRLMTFNDFPLFGTGPAKNQDSLTGLGSTIYDNSYLLLLITSGLIGLFLYMLLFFRLNINFLKLKDINYGVKYLVIPLSVLTLIYFVTTDLLWNIYFVDFYYLIIGVFYSFSLSKSKICNH